MMERSREPAHRQFEDMAVSHVLGGLNSNEGRLFRSHLVDCQSCRARVGELRAIAHDLADVERDERRTAERRRVDTKPVELELADDDDEERGLPRRWLAGAAVALVMVLGLASWNFVLRGNNAQLRGLVEQLEEASVAVEFGESWSIDYGNEQGSARAVVTTRSGDLTLLLEGVQDSTHQVFIYDGGGDQLRREALTPTGGRWVGVIDDVPERADRVVVKRTSAVTDQPSGPTVLEATRG